MQAAIDFLRDKGYQVNDNGIIISELPIGEEGIKLVDELEDATNCEFTIMGNHFDKLLRITPTDI